MLDTAPSPTELPRGRHGLSRDQVAESQQRRIVGAMVAEVAAVGYANTTVAAVTTRAGVSSRAFYEHFVDREDCFVAAHDTGTALLFERLERLLGGSEPAAEKVALILDGYLELLAASPDFARAFLVEAHGAGPRALERRLAAVAHVSDLVAGALELRGEAQRFRCHALVAAVIALATERLVRSGPESLAGLTAPLADMAADMLPPAAGA